MNSSIYRITREIRLYDDPKKHSPKSFYWAREIKLEDIIQRWLTWHTNPDTPFITGCFAIVTEPLLVPRSLIDEEIQLLKKERAELEASGKPFPIFSPQPEPTDEGYEKWVKAMAFDPKNLQTLDPDRSAIMYIRSRHWMVHAMLLDEHRLHYPEFVWPQIQKVRLEGSRTVQIQL